MSLAEACPAPLGPALREAGLDTLDGAFAYGGGRDLPKGGLGTRQRTQLEIADAAGHRHVLYLKRYGPEGLGQRWRRLWTYGRRSSPAGTEFQNILAARAAGFTAMDALAFDDEFDLWGAQRGYVVLSAVPGEAMSRCLEGFLDRDATGERTALLTQKLASLVRAFHNAGHVHRDLYASHVFLDESGGDLRLHLIDLARMFRPRLRRLRWRVKDLAALRYSMPRRWLEGHWEAFLRAYCGGDEALRRRLDRKSAAKAEEIRRRTRRRCERARRPEG